MTTSEGHLLTYLARYAPCPVGELRRVFGLKGSTLTSMLDRLERDGRVRRAPNPEDRRSFLLEIEPPGRRIAATLRQEIERLEAAIRDEIDDRDLEGFSAVMRAIEEITRVHLRQETRR